MKISLHEYSPQYEIWKHIRDFEVDDAKVETIVYNFKEKRREVDFFYRFDFNNQSLLTINPFLFDNV